MAAEALHNRTKTVGKHGYTLIETVDNIASEVTAGGNITVTSGGDTTLVSTKIAANDNVDINAGGTVALLTTKDFDMEQVKEEKKSLLWQSSKDQGHADETVNHVEITAGGTVNITGADGVVVEYKDFGNLEKSVEILSQVPELAYLAQIKNNPGVNWSAVQEAHEAWDYKAQGLTPAAGAIIAIAVAAATAGAGAALGGAVAGAAGIGSGAALTGTSAVMANAAFASLVSTASISVVNNRGDIGAV